MSNPSPTVAGLHSPGPARGLRAALRSLIVLLLSAVGKGGVVGAKAAERLLSFLPRGLDPPSGSRVRRLGFHWSIDPRDNIQRTLYYTGTYDALLLRAAGRILRKGDVVIDVGANIGLFSLVVAKRLERLGGGTVFAVEPATEAFRLLTEHVEANALQDLVAPVRVAFGRDKGTSMLFSSPRFSVEDIATYSLVPSSGEAIENVPVVGCDDWVAEAGVPRVDIVKIDVEGAESDVLAGMSNVLTNHRPRALIVEIVDPHLRRAGSSAREVMELMQRRGYDPYPLRARSWPRQDRPIPVEAWDAPGRNILFLAR
jgi:FkbM family methyltransferase